MAKKKQQPDSGTLEASICRVCLSDNKDNTFLSIFENYKEIPIVDHIIILANVAISKDDGLPSKICKCCLLQLETALNFKQKCETSDIYLHTIVGSANEAGCSVKEEQVSLNGDVKQEKPDIKFKEDEGDHIDHLESDSNYDFEESELQVKNEYDEIKTSLSAVAAASLQCHDCGEFFKSKCKLRVHWKKTHIPEFICPICKRLFRKLAPYNKHVKGNICSKSIRGIRVEGVGKQRKFYCRTCDYTGKHYYSVAKHLVTHTGERPYKCNLCSNTYTQLSALLSHKEGSHQEIRVEITCQFCGKFIRGRDRVYKHLRTHSKTRFKCDHCNKTVKSKNIMIQHLKRHGEKSAACEICAKLFFTTADLANHRKVVHCYTSYTCKICGYNKIRSSETLKRHEAKHAVYDFYCTICGLFFPSIVKLTIHKQKEHTGSKPIQFSCPLCSKTLTSITGIKLHMRVNHSKEYYGTGEMPKAMPHAIVKKKKINQLRSKKKISVEVETE